jgi:glycosyltransferase involved in cell wall biosynthesis
MAASVSIIVPMKDAQDYVGESITSILTSAPHDSEIIVVDDKSKDRSRSVVAQFQDCRIMIVEGPGTGISDCLNVGMSKASGQILMRCDADDLYPPFRISQQIKWLDEHPEFDAVCGSFSTIDKKGRAILEMPCGDAPREITGELRSGETRTHLCTFAMRASTTQRLGGFRRFFETAEDVDYQLRLGEIGRVFYEPIERYRYRIHQDSITHSQSSNQRELFELMARSTQQERLREGEDSVSRGKFLRIIPKPTSGPNTAAEHLQGLLLGKAWYEHARGSKAKAIAYNLSAIKQIPFSLVSWKSLVALVIKNAKSHHNFS